MSTRQTFNKEALASLKRKTITVEIPGVDFVFKLRQVPVSAIDTAEARGTTRGDELSQSIVDDDGNLAFDTPEGIAALNDLPFHIGLKLLEAHFELNRMSASALEATTKNSETGPNGDSVSA